MSEPNIAWRLLRRNISAGQIIGYALANFVGLAIILTAVKFHADIDSTYSETDGLISPDYSIISKKVTGLGGFFGGGAAGADFSPGEIADIEAQPWARRVGEFTAAGFNVYATVDMGGRDLSTALFLESIPSDFFDVSPRGWDYEPQSGKPLPVVISKDYLTLYNFGFAASRGMPQLSEEVIGMVPLRLSLSGAGRQRWIDARIVGFSSRLNTIAVPESFMKWANAEFAEGPAPRPSRLIVELVRPGDPQAKAYFEEHDYEVAGDKVDSGRAAYFLSVVIAIVIAIGAVISILAFFILTLSIYLLLQKNRDKIHDLMQLGYTPSAVARCYCLLVAGANIVVLAAAVAVMLAAAGSWETPLEAIGVRAASPIPAILTGVAITLLITAGNFLAIFRKVRSAFR